MLAPGGNEREVDAEPFLEAARAAELLPRGVKPDRSGAAPGHPRRHVSGSAPELERIPTGELG